MNLIQSHDGQVRSAKVKMSSGKELGCPLKLFVSIETSSRTYETHSHSDKASVSNEARTKFKTIRTLAEGAKNKGATVIIRLTVSVVCIGTFLFIL